MGEGVSSGTGVGEPQIGVAAITANASTRELAKLSVLELQRVIEGQPILQLEPEKIWDRYFRERETGGELNRRLRGTLGKFWRLLGEEHEEAAAIDELRRRYTAYSYEGAMQAHLSTLGGEDAGESEIDPEEEELMLRCIGTFVYGRPFDRLREVKRVRGESQSSAELKTERDDMPVRTPIALHAGEPDFFTASHRPIALQRTFVQFSNERERTETYTAGAGVWQAISYGDASPRSPEERYQAYLMVEPDDMPAALTILKEVAETRQRMRTSFDWLMMKASRISDRYQQEFMQNVGNIGCYSGLRATEERIILYADSEDELREILNVLVRTGWDDIEQHRREAYGGHSPRRIYTGAYFYGGREYRSINTTFEQGYPTVDEQWRTRAHGQMTVRSWDVTDSVEIPDHDNKLSEIRRNVTEKNSGDAFLEKDIQRLSTLFQRAVDLASKSAHHRDNLARAINDIFTIISYGTLDGRTLEDNHKNIARWRSHDFVTQRKRLLQIYFRNPDLARLLVEKNIVGGHGGTSASLLGVLKYGVRPQEFLERRGFLIASGEGIFGAANLNRDHVSFARWFDDDWSAYAGGGEEITVESLRRFITTGEAYLIKHGYNERTTPRASHLHSVRITVNQRKQTLAFLQRSDRSGEEELSARLIMRNFPVVYLIGRDALEGKTNRNGIQVTRGIEGEFSVKGGIASERIPIMLVRKDRIELVKTLVEKTNGRVSSAIYPIEDVRELEDI